MKTNPLIRDGFLFWLVYPVMSLATIHIGNDNGISQLVRLPSYYTDLVLAFACTFGTGLYLRWLYIRIDRRYGWLTYSPGRILMTVMTGVVLPSFIIILIEILYLIAIGIDLKSSSVYYLELPLVLVFCIIINLIYIMLYHRMQILPDIKDSSRGETPDDESLMLRHVAVQTGSTVLNISIDRVAYFIVMEKLTFLFTRDGKRYILTEPVSKLDAYLPAREFFRLNRQVIARRDSIVQYRNTETRRLSVDLVPPPGTPVYVAKTKAVAFGKWMQGN